MTVREPLADGGRELLTSPLRVTSRLSQQRKIGIGADEARRLAMIFSKLAPRLSHNVQELTTSP